jgi:hypothetical protein
MNTEFVNDYRRNALKAFHEGMLVAEEKLKKNHSSDSIETAELLDLAEFHLLTNQTGKAETEFTDALRHFISNKCEDNTARISHIVYILKTLSGLHTCQGRKHEAKAEETDALIWEERLNKLNKHL